jgi:NifB/MoaA-like Fe-S oxidoreductase
VPVVNHAFGETVTVAGLLTVADVLDTLTGVDIGDVLVLPGVMFRGPEGQSLDEHLPMDVSRAINRKVCIAQEAGLADWDVICHA